MSGGNDMKHHTQDKGHAAASGHAFARSASVFAATKGSLSVLGLSVLAVAGAAGMLLWPAVVASEERAAECGRLLSQVERHDAIAAERDAMRADLASARVAAARVLRTIPQGADQAHLMRMLAVGTGPDMGTQTIVAGEPVPATPAGAAPNPTNTTANATTNATAGATRVRTDAPLRAVPVIVEMRASFERVMEVLARAEGDRRLVRPIHIEIQRPDAGATARAGARNAGGAAAGTDDGAATLVEARLELDAVFAAAIAGADLAAADGHDAPVASNVASNAASNAATNATGITTAAAQSTGGAAGDDQ
jgi:hypothetical protein